MSDVAPRARAWLCDLDGVLFADGAAIPGADRFLSRLAERDRDYLVLTNNSLFTPDELSRRLAAAGLMVPPSKLWTSALATAKFVQEQRPGGSAYVIGEASMHAALRDVGYATNEVAPDYVILAETQHYSFEALTTAIQLIERGAIFLSTNPEPTGPSPAGSLPGCGAVASLVTSATGVRAYVVGKPNSLMIVEGLRALGAHVATTTFVGDRMETDVVAGVEAGLETVLVLSGVTRREDVERFAWRPSRIVDSVADLVDDV